MTGSELQDKIFEYHLSKYGVVSLKDLPSIYQCAWLLYIDSEKDYSSYTTNEAANDIALYFSYQYKRSLRPKGHKWTEN